MSGNFSLDGTGRGVETRRNGSLSGSWPSRRAPSAPLLLVPQDRERRRGKVAQRLRLAQTSSRATVAPSGDTRAGTCGILSGSFDACWFLGSASSPSGSSFSSSSASPIAGCPDSRAKRHLCARCLRHPATHRAHEPQDPAAEKRAELHPHRRRPAGRSGQSRADRGIREAPRRLRRRRLDGGGWPRLAEFVEDGGSLRPQPAVPERAVQHPLSFRPRTGHRL